MSNYKNIKYPAFLLFSVCMSLDAFGATATLTSLEEEKGDGHSKRARIDLSVAPTREEIQGCLQRKAQVLISELPKATAALGIIEGAMRAKVKSIQSTNFSRITAFTGLISSVKMLSGSMQNTVILAAKDCKDDNDLGMLGIVIISSGALRDQLMKFSSVLGDNEDTQDIDCSVLMDVSASIHEITKDIVDPFQER